MEKQPWEEDTHIDLKPVGPEPKWYKPIVEIGITIALAAAAAIGAYKFAEYRSRKTEEYRRQVQADLKRDLDYSNNIKLIKTWEE